MSSEQLPFSSPAELRRAFTGIFLAPIAAAVHAQSNYMLVPFACQSGWSLVQHGVALLAISAAATGFAAAWSVWRAAGRDWPTEQAGPMPRTLFLAVFGLLFSGAAIAMIAMQWIPIFLVNPCVE